VVSTVVGYAGGFTRTHLRRSLLGLTGHTEVVLVVFDKDKVSYRELLAMFWELHNPTQGMRQGNDIGTQYRSAIYCTSPEQLEQAKASRDAFQAELSKAGFGEITTEIDQAPTVYFAEAYHQQYLAKNPHGYCGIGGTACACHPACRATEAWHDDPVPLAVVAFRAQGHGGAARDRPA
jgi:peptide-methionine (S)-S-oxide reductase